MNLSTPFPVLSKASKGDENSLNPWSDSTEDDGSIHDPFSPIRKIESLNCSQSSFNRRRLSSLLASSSLHSSSSRLMGAVTKTVQLGLQSFAAKGTSAHKSLHAAERYEVMADDCLSRVIERSDEFTLKSDDKAKLQLPKGSSHSGKSSDQCSFAGDSTEQNPDDADEDEKILANDEAPLRLPQNCLQMNFDTIDVEDFDFTSPPQSVPLTPRKRKNDASFVSDHRSIQPLHVDPPTRLSPRSLRKFRLIGISDSALQPFQPKTKVEDDEDLLTLATPVRKSPTGHSPRRRPQQRRKPPPMNSQVVLDRISFGPSSQQYCFQRGSVGRTLQRSNSQNLDWKPSGLVRRELSSQSNHAPIDFGSPYEAAGSRLLSTRTGHGDRMRFGPDGAKIPSIPSDDDMPKTPVPVRRERVQFDFNPKDIDELSKAIAEARIRPPKISTLDCWSSHHQKTSKSILVQPLAEPKRKRRTLSKLSANGLPQLAFHEL
jgi:hypothetical protein